MSVEISSNKSPEVKVRSTDTPDLSSLLKTQISIEGMDATTLEELLVEMNDKFRESDGLVEGLDFLTHYRLQRDN